MQAHKGANMSSFALYRKGSRMGLTLIRLREKAFLPLLIFNLNAPRSTFPGYQRGWRREHERELHLKLARFLSRFGHIPGSVAQYI